MPAKKTTEPAPRHHVEGKTFTWTTDDGDTITVPLRLKLKTLRSLSGADVGDVDTMFAILDSIVPGQADVLDEMDVNDFTLMFTAWQEAYQDAAGASLGESQRSSD